jgi:hypothetical protein
MERIFAKKLFLSSTVVCSGVCTQNMKPPSSLKGIVSQDFGIIFLFLWTDMMFVIGPNKVYFLF